MSVLDNCRRPAYDEDDVEARAESDPVNKESTCKGIPVKFAGKVEVAVETALVSASSVSTSSV